MSDENGVVQKEKNIFNYLVSRLDVKNLENAMSVAVQSVPQAIEITIRHLDRRIDCLCHIYKGEKGYFVSGWKIPNKILHFPKLLTFRI